MHFFLFSWINGSRTIPIHRYVEGSKRILSTFFVSSSVFESKKLLFVICHCSLFFSLLHLVGLATVWRILLRLLLTIGTVVVVSKAYTCIHSMCMGQGLSKWKAHSMNVYVASGNFCSFFHLWNPYNLISNVRKEMALIWWKKATTRSENSTANIQCFQLCFVHCYMFFKKFSIYGLKFQQCKQDFVKDSVWTNFFRWNFTVLSSNRLASCSTLSNLKNEQASTYCKEVSIWWCLFLSHKIFHLMYHNHYVWWSCLLTFSKELHFTLQVFAKNSCKVQ